MCSVTILIACNHKNSEEDFEFYAALVAQCYEINVLYNSGTRTWVRVHTQHRQGRHAVQLPLKIPNTEPLQKSNWDKTPSRYTWNDDINLHEVIWYSTFENIWKCEILTSINSVILRFLPYQINLIICQNWDGCNNECMQVAVVSIWINSIIYSKYTSIDTSDIFKLVSAYEALGRVMLFNLIVLCVCLQSANFHCIHFANRSESVPPSHRLNSFIWKGHSRRIDTLSDRSDEISLPVSTCLKHRWAYCIGRNAAARVGSTVIWHHCKGNTSMESKFKKKICV